MRSREVEPERHAFARDLAAADGLDRGHHSALALEYLVGERDDPEVGRGGRRGAADRPGDVALVALRWNG
jgi:hypothetical protein